MESISINRIKFGIYFRFLPGFAPFVDGTVIVSFGSAANSQFSLPIGSAVAR